MPCPRALRGTSRPPPLPAPLRLSPELALDVLMALLRSAEPDARTTWIRRTLPELVWYAFQHPAEGYTPPQAQGRPAAAPPFLAGRGGVPSPAEEAQRGFEAHVMDAIRRAAGAPPDATMDDLATPIGPDTGGAAGSSGGGPP